MARNFRFAVYVNGGPVKLTIRPGESLQHATFTTEDEGYTSERNIWALSEDGAELSSQWDMVGTDCDGKIARGADGVFIVNSGQYCNRETVDGVQFAYPRFERAEEYHRDYSAEQMGY